MTKVTIVRVDPYSKTYGLIIPAIVQKFTDALSQLGDEDNTVASSFFPRLFGRDQGVLLLAAVEGATGSVKGFTAAATSADGQCLMLQPRLDEPTTNDAVAEMIELVEEWAASLGFKQLTMVARRADPKWLKKHGFEISRYIMTKELE
jgi:hypothetical protein